MPHGRRPSTDAFRLRVARAMQLSAARARKGIRRRLMFLTNVIDRLLSLVPALSHGIHANHASNLTGLRRTPSD